MNDRPERIFTRDPRVWGHLYDPAVRMYDGDTEYVRADLYAALEAEIADREAQYQALNEWAAECEAKCERLELSEIDRGRLAWAAAVVEKHEPGMKAVAALLWRLARDPALEGREP